MRLAVPYLIDNLRRGGFANRKRSPVTSLQAGSRTEARHHRRSPIVPDSARESSSFFILSSDADSDDSGMYEVIGYHNKRDKSVQYELLFDDCDNPIRVDVKEMRTVFTYQFEEEPNHKTLFTFMVLEQREVRR
jgi:hypothetical protein